MTRVFSHNDKIFTPNGDAVIQIYGDDEEDD